MLRVYLKKLEMGDVFDCRQSVTRSMAKEMVLLDSTPYFFHIRKILIEICVEKDQSGLQRGSHLWPKRGFT
jgi:hypothetical protein